MRNDSSSDVAAESDDEPSVTAVADEPAVTRERAPEIQPGDVLAGRYQIEAILGKGGSGVVSAGVRSRLGDRRGGQGPQAGTDARSALGEAVLARVAYRPTDSARERLPHLRHRRRRRLPVPDDGVRDGRHAARSHQEEPAASSAGRAARGRGRRHRRPGGDPRRRHRPPRRQAGQHAAHGRRAPGAVRLRARDRSSRQHDGQRLRRHAALHGARGSRGRSGDHAFRRLVARRRPPRDLLRQAT